MIRFHNLSVRGRLILGFGTIVILLAIVSASAYLGLADAQRSQNILYEHFDNLGDLGTLKSELNAERLAVSIMFDTKPSAMGPWQRDLKERSSVVDLTSRNLLVRLNHNPQEFAKIQELITLQGDFKQTRDTQILPLLTQGNAEEARKSYMGINLVRYIRMRDIAQGLVDSETSKVRDMVRETQQRTQTFTFYFAVLGAFATLVAVALAKYLDRMVKIYTTERKLAEEKIHQLNAELERRVLQRTAELEAANKELEAFAYSVSHDLRAPLRSIDGFSLALLEDYADKVDDAGKDFLQRVRAASQRMAQLIDDILNLSRITRNELVRGEVDLSALARSVAAELQQSQPDRKVEFVIQDGMAAEGDQRLLEMVLSNLIGNAWKYTGRHAAARIEFGLTDIAGKPTYFVRDDGAGFDMEYATKLFMPFQRLHSPEEFPGNGIGLALVQRIIRRHGGTVWAEGVVEHGATFYFHLN